ncbi:acylphosphatase [Bacillus shivajii]|uniref:acylphosphatase n=1 Tax=Bacillus shivajii TaxID=1983719 RepID=UPI001CFA17C0|nr:acylphosphatase [Bacillus shivajii]UCZ54045.1 acylphosphatase [Bacillus shivajii]
MKRFHGIVKGRVQGVGFRYTTQQLATEHNLTGWVKNNFDGTVEFEGQGKERELETFLAQLKRAPYPAYVEHITVNETPLQENERQFQIHS